MTNDSVPLYKHPGMQDVAMNILNMSYSSNGKMKLQVDWWNIGKCHAPYPMAVFQEFEVPYAWLNEIEAYRYRPR